MKDLDELTIDAPLLTPDGRERITLEEFLRRNVKHPEDEAKTVRMNATNLLKMLGVNVVGMTDAKRANKWLRANGFRAVHNGTVYAVTLMYPPATGYWVV
jgi:hypothetical protein